MAALTSALPRVGDRALRLGAAAAAVALAAGIAAVDGGRFASGLLLGLAVAFAAAAAGARSRDAHALTGAALARLGAAWVTSVDDLADAAGCRGHVVAGPRGVYRISSCALADVSRAPALVDAARGAAWAVSGRTGAEVRPLLVLWAADAPAEAVVGGVAVVRGERLGGWLRCEAADPPLGS